MTILERWKQPAPDAGVPTLQHHVFHACAAVTVALLLSDIIALTGWVVPGDARFFGSVAGIVLYGIYEFLSVKLAKENPANAMFDVVQANLFVWPLYLLSTGSVWGFFVSLAVLIGVYFGFLLTL